MKLLILYRPDSEHASLVESFANEYQRTHQSGGRLELLNIDSRDGSATASLYDIMDQPAILALRDDGSVLNMWVGVQLPLMDELAAYAYS